LFLLSWSGLKLKENIFVDGYWCIERYPFKYAIQCSTFQKTTMFKCKGKDQHLQISKWNSCSMLFRFSGWIS
jgi:hypothetical protein